MAQIKQAPLSQRRRYSAVSLPLHCFHLNSLAVPAVLTAREHVLVDLEQDGHSDVIFGHHSVQHDLGALGVRHGNLIELHRVFLDQSKPTETGRYLENTFTTYTKISRTHFSVLKKTAHPSTCFLSCSETSLARDFGQK